MRAKTRISERRACVLMRLSRTVLHYVPCAQPRNDQSRPHSALEYQTLAEFAAA